MRAPSLVLPMTLVLAVLVVVPAAASPPQIEQPEVIPRVTTVVRPFRVYADPGLPASSTGLRSLSLSDVETLSLRYFRGDARFVPADFTESALDAARDPAQEDLLFIARQSARFGAEHYRAFNLASAVSELDAALESYARTTSPWTNPAEVGDVWLTLALAELELAATAPTGEVAEHEARALEAFRELVRIEPGRIVDSNLYPPAVVDTWRQAYVSHFLDGGRDLRMRPDEAARLADLLDADLLVSAFTMTDGAGTRIVLQVYDAVGGRFDHDTIFDVTPELDEVQGAIEERLSTTVACQELILPPAPVSPDPETGAVYVDISFSSATYLDRPTDRLFYNRGARISAQLMVEETFGLFVSGAHWIASRDRDGELLGSLASTRGTLGALAGGRIGRLRLYGLAGFDVARIGRLRTADDFWCKVSEGEPYVFDDERRCEEGDVSDFAPQAHFGVSFGLGVDVRLVGPFWFHALAGSAVTIAPFEGRSVGTPVWVDGGLQYRF